MKSSKSYQLSIFFISSSLLAFEISLMRVLRIEGFGNFTSAAIALALTGFGAAGTCTFLLHNRIRGKEYTFSVLSAALFLFLLGLGFFLSGKIIFDPLRIVWERGQILRLFLRYFIYTLPFISGATFIVLAFSIESAGKAYFFNLIGSGFGVLTIIVSFFFIPPQRIFLVPLLFSTCALFSLLFTIKFNYKISVISLALAVCGFILFFNSNITILPYKGIKLTLNLPDAKISHRHISPFGTIEIVESSKIRIAPGLSLTFYGNLPEQKELFIDGDSLSAIDKIENRSSIKYVGFQSQAAAYILHENPDVYLIGLGGGISAERAFLYSTGQITVAEENPHLSHILKNTFREFNNDFFHRHNITVVNKNGRNYLKQLDHQWDIIEISEAAFSVSSIGGIYAGDINYNVTAQAFQDYLSHLNIHGTLSVTVPLKHPPRNILKLIHTAKYALEKKGADPLLCMVVIRSWASGTLLIKNVSFTLDEIEKIKSFCNDMFFDLVYYPGIKDDEPNQYNIVDNAYFYRYTLSMLKDGKTFSKNYLFNVKYVTDNRPYSSFFFRITKLPALINELKGKWLLVVEGGYLVLFATLFITMILSFLLIVIPMIFSGNKIQGRKVKILLYFSSIAIAFMFIEIVFIKRFTQYLANPMYSSSITIAALLIFSGIGSYVSDSFKTDKKRLVQYTIVFLVVYCLVLLFCIQYIYTPLARMPLFAQFVVTLFLIAPMGFSMGVPFPSGISVLKSYEENSIPWAWSINGYFSVISSTGAVIIASNGGLLLTGVIAVAFYVGASIFFPD